MNCGRHLLDEPLQLLQEHGSVAEDDAHLQLRVQSKEDMTGWGQQMLTEVCKVHSNFRDEMLTFGGRGGGRTLRSVSSTFWTPEFSLLILAANSLNWQRVRTAAQTQARGGGGGEGGGRWL
jgi:hypothetical protein